MLPIGVANVNTMNAKSTAMKNVKRIIKNFMLIFK